MIVADEVKVGYVLWGRKVSGIRHDKGDTQIMFEFEDGGLLHISQNRVIEDYEKPRSKDLEDAIKNLEAYCRWASTGSDSNLRRHAADIKQVLKALEQSEERLRNTQ